MSGVTIPIIFSCSVRGTFTLCIRTKTTMTTMRKTKMMIIKKMLGKLVNRELGQTHAEKRDSSKVQFHSIFPSNISTTHPPPWSESQQSDIPSILVCILQNWSSKPWLANNMHDNTLLALVSKLRENIQKNSKNNHRRISIKDRSPCCSKYYIGQTMCRRILYQSWDNIQRRSKEEQTEETGSSVKGKSALVKQ